MAYDEQSFLAGLAVGRQLKGWNLYPHPASMAGWTADPAFLWRTPGLIGDITPSTLVTLESMQIVRRWSDNQLWPVSVNNIPDIRGGTLYAVISGSYAGGKDAVWDLTVTRQNYNSPGMLAGYGGGSNTPIEASGVWVTNPSTHQPVAGGAECTELGRGTIKIVNGNNFILRFYQGAGSGDATVNGIYINERSILPGGNPIYKRNPGLSIVALVTYRNASGSPVTSPVLISDVRQGSDWSFVPGGIVQDAYTGQYVYHGMTFWMSHAGNTLTGTAASSTGGEILDITGLGNMANDQELFLAIVQQAGLTIN